MRELARRTAPVWALVAALAATSASITAAALQAAPTRDHGLTIKAVPDPILSGTSAVVYGQLKGPKNANRKVVLHRRFGGTRAFSAVRSTETDAEGFYEFAFGPEKLTSNQSWFVTSPGAGSVHSRTVSEWVASGLTVEASSSGEAGRPLTFAGQVSPAGVHAGEQVQLQEQLGAGWQTVAHATIGASSSYSTTKSFALPGAHTLRAVLSGDARNLRGISDPATVVIQQTENLSFTIGASSPVISDGHSETISGVLLGPGATTPLPGTSVTLWAHGVGGEYAPAGSTVTATNGTYSFTTMPSANELYQVRTTSASPAPRLTAPLFVAVQPVLTPLVVPPATARIGQVATFAGTIAPDEAGHAVELEERSSKAGFHVVEAGVVTAGSAYSLGYMLASAGAQQFRVLLPSAAGNLAVASIPVTIEVSVPPIAQLPTSAFAAGAL